MSRKIRGSTENHLEFVEPLPRSLFLETEGFVATTALDLVAIPFGSSDLGEVETVFHAELPKDCVFF